MGVNDVVVQHIEAFNSRNPESDPWSNDAEIVAPGARFKGRENVLGFLGAFQEAFPDGRLDLKRLLVDGSFAAAEGTFIGTHNGVLHSPAGDIPATGKPVEFRWASAYEVREQEMLSEHLYFDQMDFLGQLGLLPA